jgi:hypothetical protein
MATVGVWGPFVSPGGDLPPGEARWVDFGEHDGLGEGAALSITASGNGPQDGTYVLKVDDVNVTCIRTHQGDIDNRRYLAGCNVTNTGSTTVAYWSVLVGVIVP